MNETLREFVERRRRELREAEAPLREKLNEIDLERRELEKTAKMIGLDNDLGRPIDGNETHRKTIKEVVLEILSERPYGLTAMEILKHLNEKTNTPYPRTSLSPQLSRLKQDGKIRQSGIVWSLAKRDET